MKTNDTYDVFISYSSSNKSNAKKLATYLDDNGIKVWFDDWNLIIGENIIESISNALDNSKIIFTVIDLSYLNSEWTKKELEVSLEKNKKNIFLIDKTLDSFDFSFLNNFKYIEIDYENLDNLLEKLQNIDNLFKIKYLSVNTKKLYEEGKYQSALKEYNQLLKILEDNSENISTIYNNIASIYQAQGKYNKALKFYLKSLKINQELKLESSIAILYNNIASIYQLIGDYTEALKYNEKALKINKKINNPHAIAINYNNIASLFERKGDIEKALEYAHVSLHKYKELYGENDISLANNYNTLAVLYKSVKASDIALKFMNKSLKIQLEFLGENHPDVGKTYNNLALFLYEQENYNKAYEYMEQSIKILDNFLGKENSYLIKSRKILDKISEKRTESYGLLLLDKIKSKKYEILSSDCKITNGHSGSTIFLYKEKDIEIKKKFYTINQKFTKPEKEILWLEDEENIVFKKINQDINYNQEKLLDFFIRLIFKEKELESFKLKLLEL